MEHRVVEHSGAAAFLERCGAWLLGDEVRSNLIYGLAHARASGGAGEGPDALFATVEADGQVVGCVMRTPPHKVLITDLPLEAAAPVGAHLSRRYTTIPGVVGPEAPATAVAEAWVDRNGGAWSLGMRQRLYRLDSVDPPEGVEGRLRRAEPQDEALAMEWGRAFARDAASGGPAALSTIRRWIAAGDLVLWDVGGSARTMAVASGRTPNTVRVGYVYTPPEHRRSGYATACVAALSQRLLDDGFRCCVLYTDLDNPTSNAIYGRVGYEAVDDVVDIEVAPPQRG